MKACFRSTGRQDVEIYSEGSGCDTKYKERYFCSLTNSGILYLKLIRKEMKEDMKNNQKRMP